MEKSVGIRLLAGAACILLAIAALLLFGCVPANPSTGTLTIRLADSVLKGSRSVMPGVSLVGDHFAVHGAGVSGQADGTTFDMDITVSGGEASIELLPGGWTITATVYNADAMAIGEGSASATITVGTPATIAIDCLPYDGIGTVNAAFSWVPDVLAVPQIEAEIVGTDSVVHAIPMIPDSSVAAHGSLSAAQGWFIAFMRLRDNGVLSAGIVRSLRIAANASTTWTERLTVNQLQGSVTLDTSFAAGLPLNITASPSAGDAGLYDDASIVFTISDVDNDPGTIPVYAWYMNGQAVAISTSNTYTADAASFTLGSRAYLSAVVFQDDGKRAGDVQWVIVRQSTNPALDIHGAYHGAGGAATFTAVGMDCSDVSITIPAEQGPDFEYFLSQLPLGTYKLRVSCGSDYRYWNAAGTGTASMSSGDVLSVPNPSGSAWSCNF